MDGDVLKNLTSKFVARLLGHSLAHTLVYGVALSCERPAGSELGVATCAGQ